MATAKILAVDDDPKILKILRHCLEKEGFQVVTAADGEAAVKAAKLDRPDLVILDLMLPKINGLDVCKRLSAAAEDLPIIILSAKGDELDRIVGLRMGVDDYVAKPFSPTELVLRVRAVLRRSNRSHARQEENPISCGDITIDPRTRTVTVRSQPVILTGKEFDLLFLMMSHSQQVFTRMQLLNKIWNSDYQGDENTVTVHIRRLREKIEPDPSQPCYIQTVWGVGYKFSCNGT